MQCARVVAEALHDRRPTRVLIVAPMRLPLLASHSSTAEWSPQLPFTMTASNAASCAVDSLPDTHHSVRRAVAPTSSPISSGITRALHWFDPLQPSRISVGEQPHGSGDSAELRDAFLQIDEFDRSAGSLGILPESLRLVLRWRDENGAPCSLKMLDRMLALLRAAIFDHALSRWSTWQRMTSQTAGCSAVGHALTASDGGGAGASLGRRAATVRRRWGQSVSLGRCATNTGSSYFEQYTANRRNIDN